jgi:hypothetical protein
MAEQIHYHSGGQCSPHPDSAHPTKCDVSPLAPGNEFDCSAQVGGDGKRACRHIV